MRKKFGFCGRGCLEFCMNCVVSAFELWTRTRYSLSVAILECSVGSIVGITEER